MKTGRFISWWENGSPFPSCVTHADEISAHAHALYVSRTTGFHVEIIPEESK